MNGQKYTGSPKVQGLINLVDSKDGDGSFCVVPGFHHHLKTWAQNNPAISNRSMDFLNVPDGDPLHSQFQVITARSGSLIVWLSDLPHANTPVNSGNFRIVEYIKMFPAQERGKGTDFRMKEIEELTSGVEITELGQKLFGLKSYN